MKKGILSFLAFGAALPSYATPERFLAVNEDMIGLTNREVFIELNLGDNAGSHYTSRLDQYVVRVDYFENKVLNYWPIRSTIAHSVDGFPGELIERDWPERFNPNEILIEGSARPVLDMEGWEPDGYKIKNGSLITNFADPSGNSGAVTLLSGEELQAIADAQIGEILALYPPLSDEELSDLSGEFVHVPRPLVLEDCRVSAQFPFIEPDMEKPEERFVPLRVACEFTQNGYGEFSFFVFVADWHQLETNAPSE